MVAMVSPPPRKSAPASDMPLTFDPRAAADSGTLTAEVKLQLKRWASAHTRGGAAGLRRRRSLTGTSWPPTGVGSTLTRLPARRYSSAEAPPTPFAQEARPSASLLSKEEVRRWNRKWLLLKAPHRAVTSPRSSACLVPARDVHVHTRHVHQRGLTAGGVRGGGGAPW